MRRTLVIAAAVLALLVAGTWFIPGMLDWNRYRDGIAALAAQRLGRPVHIGGAVTLQLLPQPILTAADIAIDDAGDGINLQARALRLRVALGPLLAGQIDARELTLQGADLRLPWPPPAGTFAQRPPAWVTGLRARVEDSRLQLGGLTLTGIDATLTTDPDTGTLAAAGTGQSGPRVWQFTARLGRPGRDGAAGLDLSLDGQGPLRDTGGTFSGQIAADGALMGRVAARGPDLSQLMPAPATAWQGDGRLSAAGGLAVADDLALQIGGAPARGAVALRVQPEVRLDLAIAAGRLDLDAWLPALLVRNPGTLRASIPTGIDLSAEAATLAGGTIRRLRGAFDVGTGPILLRDVTAVLPGEAQLSLSGQLTNATAAAAPGAASNNPPPRFDGAVRLAAPDLQTTIRWLQNRFPAPLAVPPGVLRRADLSAHIVAEASQLAIAELRGTIDDTHIAGTAAVRLPTPLQRPNVTAALTLDHLLLNAWLPFEPGMLTLDAAKARLAKLRLADADIRLQIAQADWAATSLGAVNLDLSTEATRVQLRRLEAQPLGMRLAISGSVNDAGRLADAKLDLAAPDLSVLQPLLAGLTYEAALDPLLRGPGTASLQANGPVDAIAAKLALELADLRVEAQPLINLPASRAAGPLTLHHPGAPRLLETLGFGPTAAWLGDGSLSLVGQVAATPARIELENGTLAAGAFRATSHLVWENRRLSGQVSAESLPLPSLYPKSPDPIPFAQLRSMQAAVRLDATQVLIGLTPVLQSATADLSLDNGLLRLGQVTGRLAGAPLSGSLTINAGTEPPSLSAQAQLTSLAITAPIFDTPLDITSGQAEATISLSAAGYSPAALLATLGGKATIGIKDGTAKGIDLAAAGAALTLQDGNQISAAARSALISGSTGFTNLDAPLSIAQGIITTDAKLASTSGTAEMTGSLDLRANALDLRLTVTPALDAAPGLGLRLTGAASDPARTPELAGLARWIAGRLQP